MGKQGLRRELKLAQTVAISIGICAPTAVLALNGALPASMVGTSVPLVLLIGSAIVTLVAYGFVRLSGEFAHSGSVYAFTGMTLGPRAGFFAGWAILLSYGAFVTGTAAEVGLFGSAFLSQIGIDGVDWIWISLVAWALVAVFALADIKFITDSLLTIEGISVVGILIVFAFILIKILSGSAPDDQTFSLSPFGLPKDMPDVGWSTVFLAAVGGFISFAGFEGAATLGEESENPRRTIPRALIVLVAGMTTVFTLGFFIETLGFGLTPAGTEAFAGSENALADLGQMYIGSGMADFMAFAAVLSGFGTCLGCAIAASRVLFALGRDAVPESSLGSATKRGVPSSAIYVVMAIAVVVLVGQRLNGTSAANSFFYPATLGVLTILVAYICVTLGTLKYFFLGRRIRAIEAVIPLAALGLLGYVLYKQIFPVPPAPYNHFPYYAGAYLLAGAAIVVLVPSFARNVGKRLATEVAEAPEPETT